LLESSSAAAPATCGEAIDVPEIVAVDVVELLQAEVIALPGAKMSTQLPQLEKEERASLEVVEPTVSAFGVEAGEELQALAFSFPAATAKVMPSAIAFCVAVLSAAE
jgi:Asp/Glu/hydantoin racemase